MSYTATAVAAVVPFGYPRGLDITQNNQIVRGQLSLANAAYNKGGLGSTGFQVTAVTVLGVVTYNQLVGLPLQVGQKVVIFNTASNTNDGTYTIASVLFKPHRRLRALGSYSLAKWANWLRHSPPRLLP
jgi:hypothetical protein